MAKTGRPKAIGVEQHSALRALVQAHPEATQRELLQAWGAASGRAVSAPTFKAALAGAGLVWVKARSAAERYGGDPEAAKRYGYTKAHRCEQGCYAGSLTPAEWALAQDLFELPEDSAGRPPVYDRQVMVDACCYALRTGCSWRTLPKGIFPPWPAVYKAFARWAAKGKFEQLQDRLRQQWRQRLERNAQPSAAIIDSQSTRTSPQGGVKGYDAAKKVKGRKRHLVVDTLGLLLAVVVTSAAVQDRDAAGQALAQAQHKTGQSIQTLLADSVYAGETTERVAQDQGVGVQIIRGAPRGRWDDPKRSLWPEPSQPKAQTLSVRWIVERSHGWLERQRRLVMHHDRKPETSRAWVWLAQARMLLRRLA